MACHPVLNVGHLGVMAAFRAQHTFTVVMLKENRLEAQKYALADVY